MTTSPVTAVLLDLGGPILNEDREYAAWDAHLLGLLSEEGLAVDRDAYRRACAAATRACHPQPRISALWTLLRPDLARFRRLKEAFRLYTSRPERPLVSATVRPGAHEAISQLGKDYTLALAANQPSAVRDILDREGILDAFSWQQVSEDLGVAKPDLLFFQMVLDGLGVPANSAVMVGDRLDADVLPAKTLGLRTIRVLSGPYAEQIARTPLYQPDATVDYIADLPTAVTALAS